MFGRATIRLGIGPHSSFICNSSPDKDAHCLIGACKGLSWEVCLSMFIAVVGAAFKANGVWHCAVKACACIDLEALRTAELCFSPFNLDNCNAIG